MSKDLIKNDDKDDITNISTRFTPEGVKTLLGDPKKAIIKLSVPMIIAMSVHTIYNLVDAIWVSGLGPDALSAVGFFFPFFFMAMALATGLGIGGGSAISRRIGAKDKKGADSVAVHTIYFMIIIALIFSIPLFIFAEPIFIKIGAGDTIDMVVSYAKIIFAGSIIIFYVNIAVAILRAEGDVKRVMYVMVFGGILNIFLDPIFIYTLDLGVAGAAWATMISISISSAILFKWMFFDKRNYVTIKFHDFKFDRKITRDILRTGVPGSIMQLSMAISMLVINVIIVHVANTDGVAVFTTGWRVSTVAILPLMGIATGVMSVTGAAYGAKDYKKLKTAFYYAIKIGILIEIIIALASIIFAPQIATVFTQDKDSARIKDDIVTFLRIMGIFYPGIAIGMLSSSMFQGTGKGLYSLIVTLLRSIFLTIPLIILFSMVFDFGLKGIWVGIVIANLLGSSIAFLWARYYIKEIQREENKDIEAIV